ncbi:hypothetical protein [Shewanella algae]|uniref:hypothetical protein n=1 Tax=Shewanella algae TaxID=38313 RepID=UPI00399B46D3
MDYKRKLRQSIFSKYVLLGLLTYTLWVSFWMIYANIWFADYAFFDTHIPSRKTPSDYAVSYAASSFDSLIFFLFVGSVLTLLTTKSPEDEKLSTKVDYIFPGTGDDEKLSIYLQQRISSLACICPLTKRTITFQKFKVLGDDEYAIKVYTKTNSLIKNIHNNHEYILENAIFRVSADLLENTPTLGEIHDVAILKRGGSDELLEKEHILNGAHTLTNELNDFTQQYRMQLSPNETIQFMTSGWMWQSNKKPMTYTAARYTQKQHINLYNELDTELKLKITSPTKGSTHITIPAQSSTTELFDVLSPGEKISIELETTKVDIEAAPQLN